MQVFFLVFSTGEFLFAAKRDVVIGVGSPPEGENKV